MLPATHIGKRHADKANGLRKATIPGFVGAGGLGVTLFWDISVYEFERATTSVILMILMITAIDRFCLYLRKKII